MVEATADARRTAVRQGVISKTLTAIAQAIKWLLFSLIFSIVVEWIGMILWWPEAGIGHSRDMLARELSYLQSDFRRSILTSEPARFAVTLADKIHHYLFEVTKVTALINWITPPPQAEDTGLRTHLHNAYQPIANFTIAAMQVTQVFAVRLAILLLATPVFLMFSIIALVDGLVRRDLRRWGGGRESSFVYHYAKKTTVPLVVLAWILCLSLPFSLHPTFIILPFAALFALAMTVTVSAFKKYL